MIYLSLAGRIGNQLFMYAAARTLQEIRGDRETIVIDDSMCTALQYTNSLQYYPLDNVEYVHDRHLLKTRRFWKQRLCIKIIQTIERKMDANRRNDFELKYQKIFNWMGVMYCENGITNYPINMKKDIYMWGYFQSEKFFLQCRDKIIQKYALNEEVNKSNYPNLEKIQRRNTVCISIKVQHNIGNKMYDVCSDGYWEKAISYIVERVKDPLFFICSDNLPYVQEHLIDCEKNEVVMQDSSYPVHISLAVMAQCKHFIIGNTSFGWWAQYLSVNPDKIVVAPSRWYGIDFPCNIYQEHWHRIEV